jgi:RND family efflux transporter MFP subunit
MNRERAGSHRARLLLVPIIACAVTACYFFPREEKVPAPPLVAPPPVTYNTVDVRRGTIEQSVSVPGTFVYADIAKLSFPSRGGWLAKIRFQIGDAVKAGEVIAELETGSLENSIEQQKLLLRRAELSAERTRLVGGDRFQVEMAQIDVSLARLQLQSLQAQLAESRLISPLTGVVVYLVANHPGITVNAYSTIAQVADPSRLLLIYKGEKAVEFRLGMKVSVTLGEKGYAGDIVLTPATVPPDATEDLLRAVLVSVDRLPPDVKEGSIATIKLLKARRDGVLTVPRDAVTSFDGKTFVQVLEGGIKKDRSVELGIQSDTLAEVVKGLAPGDKVVYQ